MSYHVHSKLSRTEEIVRILKESCLDENRASFKLVLVSDAGTPGISDPGSELVGRIRSELSSEIADDLVKIEALPGPSALTAALSIAGVPCSDFVFMGFLPHKKGRQTLFREIADSERTVVFYESPHRIMKTLEALREEGVRSEGKEIRSGREEVGMVERGKKKITICRELTKIFEEVVDGSAEEVFQYFTSHPDKVRGEFVVIVS